MEETHSQISPDLSKEDIRTLVEYFELLIEIDNNIKKREIELPTVTQ